MTWPCLEEACMCRWRILLGRAVRSRKRLSQHGIQIHRLEVIPPSMEDVFVAMIEEEERKAL